jgi:hypothetical protein
MDLLPFTANCTPKSLSIRYLNVLDQADIYATLILYRTRASIQME